MKYNFKEYKTSFNNRTEIIQEKAIVQTIMNLLNKNKYDNLEKFITKNSSYQEFFNNFKNETIMLHFKPQLKNVTEKVYIQILENLKLHEKLKKQTDKENIQITNINKNQYVSLKTKDDPVFLDNSGNNKSIDEQTKDLQPTQQNFQTTNPKKNTENIFKELEKRKEVLNLNYLNEINYDLLNNEEKLLFQVASNYQKDINQIIKIDLKKGVIVDEANNISKIEEVNGEFIVIKNENGIEKQEKTTKTFQKSLTPSRNTIHSN